jgi:hypothetical protein
MAGDPDPGGVTTRRQDSGSAWGWLALVLIAFAVARYRRPHDPAALSEPGPPGRDDPVLGGPSTSEVAVSRPGVASDPTWQWLGLILFLVAVALYLLARYHGYWAEADSATFARHIGGLVRDQVLVPAGEVYPNGYLHQGLSALLIAFAGVDVPTLQQRLYPLVAAIIVPAAWMTYRALTGSALGATLSTIVLLTLPDFVFVILRSSHEKFSRTLILACLFLLVTTLVGQPGVLRRVVLASLFWLTCYALIATNLLIASSFIAALGTAAAFGFVLSRARRPLREYQAGFGAATLVLVAGSLGLLYLFVFHAYPPAAHNILVIQDTWNRIVALLTEPTPGRDVFGAYDYITTGWVDPRAYVVLSAASWLVLLASLAVWLHQGWRWLVRSDLPARQTSWTLWLLYAAFMLQGGLAIVSDASGSFGSNLQVRFFPSLTMIAAAMIGIAIADWRPRTVPRALPLAVSGAVVGLALLSVVKATNDPVFSNKWSFYRPSEIAAIRWQDDHLVESEVWTEFDERLVAALEMELVIHRNTYSSVVRPGVRDMVASDVTRLRASRIGQPLPVPPDAWRIYDNGLTQLYHLRPETPYQR